MPTLIGFDEPTDLENLVPVPPNIVPLEFGFVSAYVYEWVEFDEAKKIAGILDHEAAENLKADCM
jgi:hypothetical protein